MKNLVRWLKDVTMEDALLVGNKAARIAELYRSQISGWWVPAGFSVTVPIFQCASQAWGIEKKLHDLHYRFHEVSFDDLPRVEALAQAYITLLTSQSLPSDIANELTVAFEMIGSAVAVRSSATCEDSNRSSCAGVFETVLGVNTPAAFLQAVQQCWASLYASRALHYFASMGLSLEKAAMAVLVQEMVPAQKAGVIYTNWRGDILIEVCAGLGEPLVSGDFSPNQYIVDRTSGAQISFSAGNQRLVTVFDQGRLCRRTIDDPGRLTDAELKALTIIARSVESLFKSPQDVEWAIAEKVYVLQSRPLRSFIEEGE